jgi:hypothetical protein
VSSRCSGGEHDSTGLRAKQKLITPLLRCASPKQLRLTANFLDDTAKQKGEPSAPLFAFRIVEKLCPKNILEMIVPDVGLAGNSAIAEAAIDGYGDAKPADGGAGPWNADDDAGRATRRDWCLVAARDALS